MAPIPRSPLSGPLNWQPADYRQLEALWSALAPFGEVARPQLPLIELRQSEDSVIITATLPGIAPEAVQVEAQTRSLTLLGRQSTNRSGLSEYRARYQAFQHTLPLPVAVHADQMQVLLQDNSLIITLPKVRAWSSRAAVMAELTQRLTGFSHQPIRRAGPTSSSWQQTLNYPRQRLSQGWRQLQRWAGRQLHRLGDRLLEDR